MLPHLGNRSRYTTTEIGHERVSEPHIPEFARLGAILESPTAEDNDMCDQVGDEYYTE